MPVTDTGPTPRAPEDAAIKVSIYIAASLDGFIARPDGALDWLPGADGAGGGTDRDSVDGAGEDYGHGAFMKSVDTLVMGRHTFEQVLTFGDWPYEVPVVVLSSQPVDIPASLLDRVDVQSGTPAEIVARLEGRGVEHIYVDGGITLQRFLRAGVVGQLIVTRVPVLIGSGIPLFGPLDGDIALHHVETRSYPSGLVQSIYTIGAPLS